MPKRSGTNPANKMDTFKLKNEIIYEMSSSSSVDIPEPAHPAYSVSV